MKTQPYQLMVYVKKLNMAKNLGGGSDFVLPTFFCIPKSEKWWFISWWSFFPWNNVGVAFKTQKKCLASWEIHLKKKKCGSCNCNLALQPFAAPVCSQEDHVPPGHLLYELSDAMWWRCPSRASELRSCGQHDSDPLPKTGNSYMIHNSNQQYYRNCFIYIIITATNRFRERER